MRKLVNAFPLSLLLIFLMAGASSGAGFALYEYGSRGNALGGTLIGRADDPSAVAYNPAGITQLEGTRMMTGFTAITPSVDFDVPGSGTYSNIDKTWIPPHFYYTRQIDEKYWFGLSTISRFGLGSEFEDDWPGRYNSYYACIRSISVVPAVAMKVSENLSAALGIEAMWFEFEQKRKISFPYAPDIGARLKGDDWGFGWNFSLHFRPSDRLKIGMVYRSEVEQTVEGNASFSLPEGVSGSLFPDTTATGKVTTPESLGMGIACQLNPRTSIEADAVYTKWSSFDNLAIRYGRELPAIGTDTTSSAKNWRNVWRYQFGIEHALSDRSRLRLGYVYDRSPIPDETVDYIVPSNDRRMYSIGYGLTFENWTYDLFYAYLDIEDRHIDGRGGDGVPDSDLSGSDTHMFGISVSYRF